MAEPSTPAVPSQNGSLIKKALEDKNALYLDSFCFITQKGLLVTHHNDNPSFNIDIQIDRYNENSSEHPTHPRLALGVDGCVHSVEFGASPRRNQFGCFQDGKASRECCPSHP